MIDKSPFTASSRSSQSPCSRSPFLDAAVALESIGSRSTVLVWTKPKLGASGAGFARPTLGLCFTSPSTFISCSELADRLRAHDLALTPRKRFWVAETVDPTRRGRQGKRLVHDSRNDVVTLDIGSRNVQGSGNFIGIYPVLPAASHACIARSPSTLSLTRRRVVKHVGTFTTARISGDSTDD